jgi:hypothetical protein
MAKITGQSGRLNLKDSSVMLGNWNIFANIVGLNEPGQSDWSGSFEIQKSDYFSKLFNSVGELNADFYGDENYNGKIIIIDDSVSSYDDPVIVGFRVTDGLKKSSFISK